MNSKNLPQYLSSSNVIFIVYDVTNPESFANIDDWLRLVCEFAPAQCKVNLVGNKVNPRNLISIQFLPSSNSFFQVDLIANRRVSKEEHDNYLIRTPKFESSFFMSARTGENVVKAFYKVSLSFIIYLSHLI